MKKDAERYVLFAAFGWVIGVFMGLLITIALRDTLWERRVVDNPKYIEAVRARVLAERQESKSLQNKQ